MNSLQQPLSRDVVRQDNESLKNEVQVLHQKLESKCQALSILSQNLEESRQQKEQFQLMAEQVQKQLQGLKRHMKSLGPLANSETQSMITPLQDMKKQNSLLQSQIEELKKKFLDSQGDIKLLREQLVRFRVGAIQEGLPVRDSVQDRGKLIEQLEQSQEEVAQLEKDIHQILDEKEELINERDTIKGKFERLNNELNLVLQSDPKKIVDIEAIVSENRFLSQQLNHLKEEQKISAATVNKYKEVLEKRKNKGIRKLGQTRKDSSSLVLSQKQVQHLLDDKNLSVTSATVTDLQSLGSALLDTMNDKGVALSHQRKLNRILGMRISELEEQVRSLDLSESCKLSDEKTKVLHKLKLECEELQSLSDTDGHLDDGHDSESKSPTLDMDDELKLSQPEYDLISADNL